MGDYARIEREGRGLEGDSFRDDCGSCCGSELCGIMV